MKNVVTDETRILPNTKQVTAANESDLLGFFFVDVIDIWGNPKSYYGWVNSADDLLKSMPSCKAVLQIKLTDTMSKELAIQHGIKKEGKIN